MSTKATKSSEKVTDDSHLLMRKILKTLRPAFLFENILGIFRLRVTEQSVQRASKVTRLYVIFLITICNVIYFLFGFDARSVSEAPVFLQILDNLPNLVVLIQYSASTFVTTFLLGSANLKIITYFAKCDSKLKYLISSDFYKTSRNNNIAILLTVFISHSTFIASDCYLGKYKLVAIALNYITYLAQNIEIIVFCLAILMLKHRLQIINRQLKFTLKNKYEKEPKTVCLNKSFAAFPLVSLRELALAYDIIGELSSFINRVFNLQMLSSLISASVYVIITLWSSIFYIRIKILSGQLVTQLAWCVVEIFPILFMSLVCEGLLRARLETRTLVTELVMDYAQSAGARAQAKAFLALIDVWPLRIHVFDMIAVDTSLMFKFLSASTSYLIVILQLSKFV